MGKKIEVTAAEVLLGSTYPAPFHEPCRGRERTRLGAAAGLTQFGVNRLRLPPGAWSSQRHWHLNQDEFVMVLAGEVVLVTDAGEEVLRAGDCAGFPAGDGDGHHLQNRSDGDAVVLEVGTSSLPDPVAYSDIDMLSPGVEDVPADYTHRDGTPYSDMRRRGPED